MDDLVLAILTVLVLATGVCVKPTRAACPPGWNHHGVSARSSSFRGRGEFSCSYFPFAETDKIIVYPGRIGGRIYCPDTQMPVQVDERTVKCARAR